MIQIKDFGSGYLYKAWFGYWLCFSSIQDVDGRRTMFQKRTAIENACEDLRGRGYIAGKIHASPIMFVYVKSAKHETLIEMLLNRHFSYSRRRTEKQVYANGDPLVLEMIERHNEKVVA